MAAAVAVTDQSESSAVAAALEQQVREALSSGGLDVGVLFCSPHYEDQIGEIAARLHEALGFRSFIGATAETVIAGEREYEGQAAVVLWAARMPGVRVSSFHLSQEDLKRLGTPDDVRDQLGVSFEERPAFILLGEPFSFPMPEFLSLLSAGFPDCPAVGGMASAAETPGQNVILFDGQPLRSGVAGLALSGNLHVDAVVSQGCRPIGRHMVITQAEKNVIRQLGGRAPLQVVNELIQDCTPRDVELMKQRGLLVGCVINEHQGQFGTGDFLIRSPIGFDAGSGALLINDLVRVGQTIQFHVRDASSATQDLNELLAPESGKPIAGALLFSCNGRGTRLFSRPHHDARAVVDACGSPPLAGIFCAGEIGPVGSRNYLHGFTASVAMFGPAQAAAAPR